ncbi:type II toxin-antitoxin system RelE/ParE family toxin [Mycobacteroides saopaulense]|nr:type II toxin-antitoxin system RelE/ParE family toxin [Mycobacteroides saopaulense]
MTDEKPLRWIGTSLEDLRDFPEAARQDAGYQLDRVQHGLDPHDWKPMPTVGKGCREIRVRTEDGAYRVFYVATLGDVVFVLHSFVKKSQKSSQQDINTGRARYKKAQEEL